MSLWKAGDRVADRFVIEGFLASGGMAEIYVAEMALAHGAKRRVALKRIHLHLSEDATFSRMFLDEGRITSQLQHAGILPVRDFIDTKGEVLLVLDYMPGWDLASVLRKTRESGTLLPIEHAIYIGRTVAETLDYVHNAPDITGRPLGIVHRDVNPSNIHLGEDGAVRLLDFGVAQAAALMSRASGGIKGTFAYLAPEQANGDRLDARVDLYALGLILFEMITGERALKADSDVLLVRLASAPKHERIAKLRAGVPEALDALVARLLALDPAARPSRGSEVAAALRALEVSSAAAGLRSLVVDLMGSAARPLRDPQRPLDAALRAVAGIDLSEPVTAAVAVAVPASASASETAAVVVPATTVLPAPKPRRLGRSGFWAGLGVALIFGTAMILRSCPAENVVAPPMLEEKAPPSAPVLAEPSLPITAVATVATAAIAREPEAAIAREPEVPTGTLDISSTPWARVWIDGRAVAESTPVIGLRLPAGRHTVLLKNPRTNQSARRTVNIKAREKSSVIVRLDP